MSVNQSEVERLRKLFAEEPQETPADQGCGPPEEIWAAVRGELPNERLGQLLDHTIECAACAEEWRLAMELNREKTQTGTVVDFRTRPFSWRTPLALAASLLIIVLGWTTSSIFHPASEFRGSGKSISSPVDGQSLPRDQFVLRWEAGPRDSKYNLLATREDLSVIARSESLSVNSFQIPAQDLAGLPAGGRVLWQVEVVLPDGTGVPPERTFITTVR